MNGYAEAKLMPRRITQSDQALALLYHARAATPFFSQGGEPCASIPSSVDSRRVLPLRSADFRDWLTANYYAEYETAPSSVALRAALRTLEARAQAGSAAAQKVDTRVSFEGDPFAPSKIFLDLANEAGEILEITSQGWRVTDNLRHTFRQAPGMLPLPIPAGRQSPAADPGLFFSTLFRLSPQAWTRALFFLASSMRPSGPYPILVLRGPASSGKSTLARALRMLIDPSSAPLRRLPASDRELAHRAQHNWVLVFDHVHRIPIKICEALCAISSGEGIETTQTDFRDPAVAEIARPMVLIAPLDEAQAPFTAPRSLANRSIAMDLAAIEAPRTEAAVMADFEALRAPMLAMLADGASAALRNIRDIDLAHVTRLPDSTAWVAAAAPALGLAPEAIVEAVSDPDAVWLGTDPLREAVYALLGPSASWTGNSASLLTSLRTLAPQATLPGSPKALGQALGRVPGISVSRDGQILKIAKIAIQSATSPNP